MDKFKFYIPVGSDPSGPDLFSAEIDAEMVFGEATRYTISSITCYFEIEKREAFDPLLDRISGSVVMSPTELAVSLSPLSLAVCMLDISALNVAYGLFNEQLAACDFSVFQGPPPEQPPPPPPAKTYTVDLGETQFQLNQGRRLRTPFLRFGFDTISAAFNTASSDPSVFVLSFAPFEQFDSRHGAWNSLIESFQCTVNLTLGETQRYAVLFDDVKINCSRYALQHLLSWWNQLGQGLQNRNIRTPPAPGLHVVNNSGERITVKFNWLPRRIEPDDAKTFDISKDAIVKVSARGVSETEIPPRLIRYPKYLGNGLSVTEREGKRRRTLTFFSSLTVANRISRSLALFRQINSKRFDLICLLPPESTTAVPYDTNLTQDYFLVGNQDARLDPQCFNIRSLKSGPLIVSVLISRTRCRLLLSLKPDPYTGSYRLKIEAPVVLKNQFPEPIVIVFSSLSGAFDIEPKKKLPIFGLDLGDGKLDLAICLKGDPNPTVNTNIQLKSGKISEVSFMCPRMNGRVSLAVQAFEKTAKPLTVLILYAPTILFNRSNVPLWCTNADRTNFCSFMPRNAGCSPDSDGVCFWGAPSFFNPELKEGEPRLPLFTFTTHGIGYTIENPIECYGTYIDDVLLLPTPTAELYIPLHYTVQSAEPYAHSSLVTITPHISVVNRLSVAIFLQPITRENETAGDPTAIPEGTRQQLLIATIALSYLFSTSEEPCAVPLQFDCPIHATFPASVACFIEFTVEVIGCEFVATFQNANLPQPIMLSNLLDEPVTACQVDADFPIVCPAEATTILAYQNPFGSTDFQVTVGERVVLVNVVKFDNPIDGDVFTVELTANADGTKVIVVSKERVPRTPPPTSEFDVIFSSLSIAFIDDELREIALLGVKQIQLTYRSAEYVDVAFLVRSFQLDDLHPLAPLRVAAAGYPEADDSFLLSASATLFRSAPIFTACKRVAFTLQPVIFFIDVSFISDLLFFSSSLFNLKEAGLLDPPAPAVASSLGQRPFSCEYLRIDTIALTIFVRTNTDRKPLFPETMPYLSLIPDITNGEIVLPAFAFEDCVMTQAFVNTQVLKPLVQAVTIQGLKLFFRIDLFRPSTGARSSNFARRVERLKSGEVQVLAQMGGSALLQGGETILGGVSKILHAVSFDKGTQISRVNSTAKDTAIGAAKAVYQGFVRGVTGVVMDPIEMKRTKGALGVFLGIGKGLIGLVVKPICGILDGGAGAMAALRSVVNNEDQDVIPPLRIARAFPDWRIGELADDEGGKSVAAGGVRFIDAVQFAIRVSRANRWIRRIELFFKDRSSDEEDARWFAFVATKLYVMDSEPKIVGKLEFRDIAEVEVADTIIRLKSKKGDVLEFEVATGIVSIHVADWLRTRIALLRVGEKE
jgi:vacuolar protein sorting-associated protein 13A/C